MHHHDIEVMLAPFSGNFQVRFSFRLNKRTVLFTLLFLDVIVQLSLEEWLACQNCDGLRKVCRTVSISCNNIMFSRCVCYYILASSVFLCIASIIFPMNCTIGDSTSKEK